MKARSLRHLRAFIASLIAVVAASQSGPLPSVTAASGVVSVVSALERATMARAGERAEGRLRLTASGVLRRAPSAKSV